METRIWRRAGLSAGGAVLALSCALAAAAPAHATLPLTGPGGSLIGTGSGNSLVGVGNSGTSLVGIGGGSGTGSSGSASGSGSAGVSTGVGVSTGGAGSLLTVHVGGTGGGTATGGGSASGGGTVGGGTTTGGGTTGGGTTPAPAPSSTSPAGDGSDQSGIAVLTIDRDVATVYPVRDGYRDDVTFTLSSPTTTGAPIPVTGTAVLQSGSQTVQTWPLTSSFQQLTWNGRVGGRVVAGVYTLAATITDAAGHAASATSSVSASVKRLQTARLAVTNTVVSGTHAMAAKPRAALARGRVAVRVTIVASHVHGKHTLSFVKGGKRISIPVRNGRHTSRSITLPKTFTSFTIKKSWKHGSVKIKSIRYAYVYKALR